MAHTISQNKLVGATSAAGTGNRTATEVLYQRFIFLINGEICEINSGRCKIDLWNVRASNVGIRQVARKHVFDWEIRAGFGGGRIYAG